MKFDYSFVDWDYTVFDAGKFEDDIWNVFSLRGVSRQDYDETYKQSLCTVSKAEFDYSFEEQIDFLRERGYKLDAEVAKELHELIEKSYLYAGSIDFIKFLKT